MSRLALLSAALLLVTACASEATTSPPTTTAPRETTTTASTACTAPGDQTDVGYVDNGDPLQRLDLYRPDSAGCSPVPVVVWVHGGGWLTGDKEYSVADKVPLWNDAGWAVASINYRLTDAALPENERVMAPTHNEDVAAALGWLVDHADELGIDAEHLALLGHSAGAGVVAALAADPTYLAAVGLEPTDLGCVGPLDTEAFSIAAAVEGGPPLANVYEVVFGTDPDRWEELSPLTHVGDAPIPPLFLVTRGTPARRQQVADFARAVERSDGEVTVVDLPTFSHEDVNKRIGDPTDTQLTPALANFLTTCLTG